MSRPSRSRTSGLSPRDAATRLGERGYAVWYGDYYAVEVMKRLGAPRRRRPRRDRPLQHGRGGRRPARGARGAVRLLVLGGTKFLGRAVAEAALARGHELTLFTRGQTNPELFPEAEHLRGDRDGDLRRSRAGAGTPSSTRPATSRASSAPRPSCSATRSGTTSSSRASPPTGRRSRPGSTRRAPLEELDDSRSEECSSTTAA